MLYPLGVNQTEDGVVILFRSSGDEAYLILESADGSESEKIPFKKEDRTGDVFRLELSGTDFTDITYRFEVDGKPVDDPQARIVIGREIWNDVKRSGKPLKFKAMKDDFDWGDDVSPETPYSDTIIYRLHVRGFTKHPSSKVKNRGTYAGVIEKIPYLTELGVTAVELMPVTEFDEIMTAADDGNPMSSAGPSGIVNYWGYGPSFKYAVKSAYASGKGMSPENEFKTMVKSLHAAGLECIIEMYFTGEEAPDDVLGVLRYWVEEYHVDGFALSGFARTSLIADDPFLSRTKIIADNWNSASKRSGGYYPVPGDHRVTVREKHLAECNSGFEGDMRRFLKGDEGMINALAFRTRNNPASFAEINYMASTNGFTMMDMVSYDRKHNEDNGEDNRDGSDENHSWNCGAEGPTRKRKVTDLRKRQLMNAYLLLFLSQGVPMILAGDEFGNSQNGNNNAWCQDNETSWLNWKLLDTNRDLFDFVKNLIAFRKDHPVFHMEREPRIMDYRSLGLPDVSYHGEEAWCPGYENFRREFAILYFGDYAKKSDGTCDDTFFVIYNMHWEPHEFGLPRLSRGERWHVVYDTSKGLAENIHDNGEEPVPDLLKIEAAPRSIMVLAGRKEPPEEEPEIQNKRSGGAENDKKDAKNAPKSQNQA